MDGRFQHHDGESTTSSSDNATTTTGHRSEGGGSSLQSLSALALTVTDNTTRIHSLMRSAITSINPFSFGGFGGDSGRDVSFDGPEVPM
jgi:hypothetical protein